jgi:acyl dehydratase
MHSRYYEDISVGDTFVTGARTVTESDVMSFCGLAGIFNPLFVDEMYAKENTIFGTRVVPGPLTYILSVGMWMRMGLFTKTVLAFLGVDAMRAYAPVRHGDTLHCEVEIIEARETSKQDRGVLKAKHTTLNQNSERVMDMIMTYMVKMKSYDKDK